MGFLNKTDPQNHSYNFLLTNLIKFRKSPLAALPDYYVHPYENGPDNFTFSFKFCFTFTFKLLKVRGVSIWEDVIIGEVDFRNFIQRLSPSIYL